MNELLGTVLLALCIVLILPEACDVIRYMSREDK